ncbi:MAG: signal peptidase I [Clostridia bacterium]|nr:signal peptidase I [Clostridia bacterium]
MQKSTKVTIALIMGLLICFFINEFYLSSLGNIYTFVINPIMYMAIAVLFRLFIVSPYTTNKFKKDTIQYVTITMLIYSIIYLMLGLITGYAKNPYSGTLRGFIINLYVHATVFISIEYIRYKLIRNVYKKDIRLVFIILVAVFSILDSNVIEIFSRSFSVYTLLKTFFHNIAPSVIKNVLFTYTALKVDFVPAMIYELLYHMLLWLPPILPDAPWIIEAMLDIVFPLLLVLFIRYYINKKDRFQLSKVYDESKPASFIPYCILLILLIWFALGFFPIKPVGIMTGSMYPEIKIGDAVLIKKCSPNDIEVQDIIEYQMEGYTVIHRVIEMYQEDGEFFFITKGDNNDDPDSIPVRESQLIGKAIYKIPYIAIPAVWLRSNGSNDFVEVELGN